MAVPELTNHRADIVGRAMLCRRTTVFPVECVIRGYISGSAWKEYAASGTLAGEKLKAGLVESEKLEQPIFSPATKAETGHDENITIARVRALLGDDAARTRLASRGGDRFRADYSADAVFPRVERIWLDAMGVTAPAGVARS